MTCKTKLLVSLLSVALVGILKFYFRSSPATQTSAPSLSKDNLPFMRHDEPFLSAKTNLSVETFTWWRINDIEWIIKAFTTGFYGRSCAPIKSKIKANKDLVLVVNPAFMKYTHEVWLKKMGSYPSTGFMTFLLTLHVCDEVHVFGFGADNKRSWEHYWEMLQNKNFKTGLHPGTHEYKIIQRLADEKTIKLYKGS